MKSFVPVFIFILVTCFSYGQTNITIIANNSTNIKFDKVDAFDLSQIEIKDTAYSDTLKLVFDKKYKDAYWIRYHANGKLYRQYMWLDPGNITLKMHFDSTGMVVDTVLNSPVYYEYIDFKQTFARLHKSQDTAALNDFLLRSYINNIDNPLSLEFGNNYINVNQNSKAELAKLKEQTDKQGDKFKWFLLYPYVNGHLDKVLNGTKLDLADFRFINSKNQKIKLSTGKKDYYILDLWFLACPPCVADHKEIAKSAEILKNKNAQLVSISTDKNLQKVNAYFKKNSYGWTSYLQPDSKKLTEELNINGFPTYVILNRSGKVVQMNNSFSQVLVWLNQN